MPYLKSHKNLASQWRDSCIAIVYWKIFKVWTVIISQYAWQGLSLVCATAALKWNMIFFFYSTIIGKLTVSVSFLHFLWSLPGATEWLDKRCWHLLTVAFSHSFCWWRFQWCCNCRRAFWSSNGMPCLHSAPFFFVFF